MATDRTALLSTNPMTSGPQDTDRGGEAVDEISPLRLWEHRGWHITARSQSSVTLEYTRSWAGSARPHRYDGTLLAVVSRALTCRLVLVENVVHARVRTCGLVGGCLRHHTYELPLPLTEQGWPVDLDLHETNAELMTWDSAARCVDSGPCRHLLGPGGAR